MARGVSPGGPQQGSKEPSNVCLACRGFGFTGTRKGPWNRSPGVRGGRCRGPTDHLSAVRAEQATEGPRNRRP